MAAQHITTDTFQKEVVDQKGLILVDFYADWCGPCKMTTPIVEELSDEIKDVKFVKINVDESPQLATSHQVFSIPTFIIYRDGKVVSQFVGAQPKEGFLSEIEKARTSS